MRAIARATFALLIAACLSSPAQQSADTAPGGAAQPRASGPRELNPGDEFYEAYSETRRSIGAAERFIREHPRERDLCAGALLNMARLQKRKGSKLAIESYRKAIDTYGDELVPEVNFDCTVENWALLEIGRLERDMGNRAKALEIFGKLMTSPDNNTRNTSRIEYLVLKQSHLKVVAEVAVQRTGPYSIGAVIPVTVTVRNPSDEPVTFKCYSSINFGHKPLTPRSGCEETTLAAGERRAIPMEFTEKSTKWASPGLYELKANLTGIPFDTNSVPVRIVK